MRVQIQDYVSLIQISWWYNDVGWTSMKFTRILKNPRMYNYGVSICVLNSLGSYYNANLETSESCNLRKPDTHLMEENYELIKIKKWYLCYSTWGPKLKHFQNLQSKMATMSSSPPRSSYGLPAPLSTGSSSTLYFTRPVQDHRSTRTPKSTLAERVRNYINSRPSPIRITPTEKKTQLTSSSTQTIGYCHELTPLLDADKQGTSRRT